MLGARTPSSARGYRIDGDADAGGRVPSASEPTDQVAARLVVARVGLLVLVHDGGNFHPACRDNSAG
jgi:hypothetical protein